MISSYVCMTVLVKRRFKSMRRIQGKTKGTNECGHVNDIDLTIVGGVCTWKDPLNNERATYVDHGLDR